MVQVWPVTQGSWVTSRTSGVSGPEPAAEVLPVQGGRGWTRGDIGVQ